MKRFKDRTILVTGAGSGIGQATVARLLKEGARWMPPPRVTQRRRPRANAETGGVGLLRL
jgi:NAD(P)-dependent dehydrogenase (short-subunit alcohol dehydrogenase family)